MRVIKRAWVYEANKIHPTYVNKFSAETPSYVPFAGEVFDCSGGCPVTLPSFNSAALPSPDETLPGCDKGWSILKVQPLSPNNNKLFHACPVSFGLTSRQFGCE